MPDNYFICIIIFGIFASCEGSPPATVKIGIMTNSFSTDGTPLSLNSQLLGTVLMAIDEINSMPDLLPRTKILKAFSDPKLDNAEAFFSSLYLAEKAFNGTGVDIVIGPISSSESISSALVLKTFTIPQISMSATSPELSSSEYPYFARVCPSDEFQGRALVDLLVQFRWRRVTVFSTTNAYGSAGVASFLAAAARSGVEVIQSFAFSPQKTDFTDVLTTVSRTSARVFVFFCSGDALPELLEQGYRAGVFGRDTQLVGSDAVTDMSMVMGLPQALRPEIMKGYLGLNLFTGRDSAPAKAFVSAYRQQASTTSVSGRCNTERDDSGAFLWQQTNSTGQVVCGGNNHSQVLPDGSNMNPYAFYAYDATFAAARALHAELYGKSRDRVRGASLFQTLVEDVSFLGVTGEVSFSRGFSRGDDVHGEGDRARGIQYSLFNFQPDMFDGYRGEGFVEVGSWQLEKGVSLDKKSTLVFNTDSNTPPLDSLPPVEVHWPIAYESLLQTAGALLIIFSLLINLFVIIKQDHRLIKMSQVQMLLIVVGAGYLQGAKVILSSGRLTDTLCGARIGLDLTAFYLFLCVWGLKTWRIHTLLNAGLRRVIISESDILIKTVQIMVGVWIFISLILVFGNPSATQVRRFDGYQTKTYMTCTLENEAILLVIIAVNAFGVALVMRTCYQARDIPEMVNEMKPISIGAFLLMLWWVLQSYMGSIDLDVYLRRLFDELGYAVFGIVILAVYFTPKVLQVYPGFGRENTMSQDSAHSNGTVGDNRQKDADLTSSMRDGIGQESGHAPLLDTSLSTTARDEKAEELSELPEAPQITNLVKPKYSSIPPSEQLQVCEAQIKRWEKSLATAKGDMLRVNMSATEDSGTRRRSGIENNGKARDIHD